MADTDNQTQAPTAPPAGETQTPAPAASPAPAPTSAEKTEDTAATQTEGTEAETKQPDKSFPITAEEISLIETESANGFFPECKKAIDNVSCPSVHNLRIELLCRVWMCWVTLFPS